MKVLIISNYKDAFNSVRPEGELFIGLQKAGLDLTIMTQRAAEFIPHFLKAGIRIIDFHPTKKLSRSAIQLIRKELKNGQYDILHLFNSKAISNGNFAAIGLPVKVLVYRGVVGGSAWYNPNAYLKHLHPRVDGITTVSKAIQCYLKQQIWWNPQKVKQFYKGQNIKWYQSISPIPLTKLGLPKNSFIVTTIANNRRLKGIRFLIQAANFLPPNLPIYFLLVGRNMDTSENLHLIQKNAYRDNFHLMGYRSDVLPILAASQVYVQPTLANKEGLGKAILEAMSLGVPPIVTNTGGPPEYVTNGQSGFVIPSSNAASIATSILQLYENESYRKKLGQRAKRVIEGKMSLKNSIKSLIEIYQGFINQ